MFGSSFSYLLIKLGIALRRCACAWAVRGMAGKLAIVSWKGGMVLPAPFFLPALPPPRIRIRGEAAQAALLLLLRPPRTPPAVESSRGPPPPPRRGAADSRAILSSYAHTSSLCFLGVCSRAHAARSRAPGGTPQRRRTCPGPRAPAVNCTRCELHSRFRRRSGRPRPVPLLLLLAGLLVIITHRVHTLPVVRPVKV